MLIYSLFFINHVFIYCRAIVLVLVLVLAPALALILALVLETIIQTDFKFVKHLIDFLTHKYFNKVNLANSHFTILRVV